MNLARKRSRVGKQCARDSRRDALRRRASYGARTRRAARRRAAATAPRRRRARARRRVARARARRGTSTIARARAATRDDDEIWDEDERRRVEENKRWRRTDDPSEAWDIDKERDALMYKRESLEALLRVEYEPEDGDEGRRRRTTGDDDGA